MVVRDQPKMNRCIRQDRDPSSSHTQPNTRRQRPDATEQNETRSPKDDPRERKGEKSQHSRLEVVRKLLLVQEHVRIPVSLVKPILHLLHTKKNPVDVPIPRQRHNGSVRLPFRRGRLVFFHRVIILRRDPVLIRRFGGGRAELLFDVRKRGRSAVLFVSEAEDVVETDLFESAPRQPPGFLVERPLNAYARLKRTPRGCIGLGSSSWPLVCQRGGGE